MCDELDKLAMCSDKVIIAGDFNLPNVQWHDHLDHTSNFSVIYLRHLLSEHKLTQLATQPTRCAALLDLIIVSDHFANNEVNNVPPIAGSDHDGQLIAFALPIAFNHHTTTSVVNYELVIHQLSRIDWPTVFRSCISADDFANVFTRLLDNTVKCATSTKKVCRRERLPRHIVRLLSHKKRAWSLASRSGDYTKFKLKSKAARSALRQYRRWREHRLLQTHDRKSFYNYVRSKLGSSHDPVHLCEGGITLDDAKAAQSLLEVFSTNFSPNQLSDYNNLPISSSSSSSSQQLTFNCTTDIVNAAIDACSNSSSSPDGISFRLLKTIKPLIILPLTIIYQHSLFEGCFPHVWKHAIVTPVYKGRGGKSSPDSYRPISLCSCLGKVLERIVSTQLNVYLNDSHALHQSQHGFTQGRSTLTNLLTTDAYIARLASAKHPFDIISFDFTAAFDKAPHHKVIAALANHGVCGAALNWFTSFLSGRSMQVRVGGELSSTASVTSGVIQGSVVGPCLYTVLIDSLLCDINVPVTCYADDVKLIVDTSLYSAADIQAQIDIVVSWSHDNLTPLSLSKCGVLHCGHQDTPNSYCINGSPLISIERFKDLGVHRTTAACHADHYREHYNIIASKAARLSGCIKRIFKTRDIEVMWPAFKIYVQPVLMYCSQVWNPGLKRDVIALEAIQRRFTKCINGLTHMSYSDRLKSLHALSLENERTLADMTIVYKCLRHKLNCPAADLGLVFNVNTVTRRNNIRIEQFITQRSYEQYFCFRVPAIWNKINVNTINCLSAKTFKKHLSSSLFLSQ
jgi:hypothetical protein